MDIATVTTMNGMLAMQRQWMDHWRRNGDGRLEEYMTATRRWWSNATEMDGMMVMGIAMGIGNGPIVRW